MLPLIINIIIRCIGLSPQIFIKRPWDVFGAVILSSGLLLTFLAISYPTSFAIVGIQNFVRGAIVLTMIPYVDAFQALFEVAAASLPLVSTLLITWLVFLLFFTIGLTQAFGLTRFGPNETWAVNFRTTPKALILLFRITLGEGRTKIMEDYAAIVSPYCTVGERFFEDDCGDPVLARIFFISWKVLSTYLFTSLFISLVYESFSNVYQDFILKNGAMTGKDIRAFKDAWALVDPKGSGFVPPELLPKFVRQLPERLGMRVYDHQFSITGLQEECQHRLPLSPGELDLEKLNARLATLPTQVVRERRRAMDRFRMELLLTQIPGSGISMVSTLSALVCHNMIDTRDYLK
jgi:hypothetical protein